MHHVHRALGEPADEDGAVDGLLLGPVGTGGREVRGGRAPRRDGLVLEVAADGAVLAVELAEGAKGAQSPHGPGDALVGDPALGALLVRQYELVRRDAQ